MKISDKDRQILRDLAKQVAALAAAPEQQVLRDLWQKHNDLHGERIMILAYIQDSWPEFFSLQIEDPLLRDWEWQLRHTICVAQIGTDEVITTYFPVPYIVRNISYGLSTKIITPPEVIGHQGAYRWEPPLKRIEDINKLVSGVSVDFEATQANFRIAQGFFGDILDIQLDGGFSHCFGDTAAMLRGLDQIMLDIYDNPQFLHELMAFLRDETISRLKYFEANGLFKLCEQSMFLSSQLPANGFDGRRVRLCDLWGTGGAQTFVGVSPSLFQEYIFEYQKPMLEMFGLVQWGCCEPLHDRIEIIVQLKNLRRIAVAPSADLKVSAEKIQDKYILSWKPNPAIMAAEKFDPEEIKKGLREAVEITKGCHLEIIMKDVTTTKGHPERLKTWVETAREVTGGNAKSAGR